MAKGTSAWGIEVGANAIKGVHLMREGDEAKLVEYDVLPFKTVLSTPDINANEAIQLGLDQFMARHELKGSTMVVSIPGHMAFARFAKLPPVDPKTIPKMVEFEARQQIPFPIEQVEWDYQVFQQDDSPDVEVGIFAITKDRVMEYLSNFRQVNMSVDGLTLSPLAVYNAMAHDLNLKSDSPGIMFVDVGTTATDVVIVENGQVWLRTLPIGGNNFTQALVKAFKLSFPKAEKLKREAGTSKYARQIFQAMRPVFADLVQEMQKTLGYYRSLNREAEIKVLMGLGSTFRLPGLQKFLKQQLQIEVLRPDGYKRISVEGRHAAEFADQTLNLATAYGLALQGVGLDRVGANLLPAKLLKQRIWRAKQPWIAAAAMLMLAASGVAWVKLILERSAFHNELADSNARVAPVISSAENLKKEWERIDRGEDPRQRIENLRRLLDYRDVWPKLLLDITEANKALNPQAALYSNDYDEIKQIPRAERRRLYIQSVDARYVVSSAPTGEAQPGQQAPTRFGGEQWFGGYNTTTPSTGTAAPAEAPKADPPKFEVTIKGVTTHQSTSDLLRTFTQWLADNGSRASLPYEIVPGTVKVLDLQRLDESLQRTPGLTPGIPGIPQPLPGRGLGGRDPLTERGLNPPGGLPGRGLAPGRQPAPGQPRDANRKAGDVADLLPHRPLSDEKGERDYSFVVTWTVQLRPPNAARGGDQADTTPNAAPTAPPAPAPTTPAAPKASTDQPAQNPQSALEPKKLERES